MAGESVAAGEDAAAEAGEGVAAGAAEVAAAGAWDMAEAIRAEERMVPLREGLLVVLFPRLRPRLGAPPTPL